MEYLSEKYIMNIEDIYYNKDAFECGKINLCIITGHSGSGKTTMGNGMQDQGIESYELDDIYFNYHFTDAQLKEYGDLIYSFFTGVGKKYRCKEEPNRYDYLHKAIPAFCRYAMKYADSHKGKRFVLNGVQVVGYMNPREFDKYAVYIKGTSALISGIRAYKRDKKLYVNPILRADFEKQLQKWVQYYRAITPKEYAMGR